MNVHKLDGREMSCPEFFLAARQFLSKHAGTQEPLLLISKAEGSRRNLKTYCAHTGFEIVEEKQNREHFIYLINPINGERE